MTVDPDAYDYDIREKPPTDSDGHPIHPERGHRICGAPKSDRTTATDHGRERDDYAYCLLAAGWGTDNDHGPCRNGDHQFTGSQLGASNPNFKDGRTSEYFRSKLSDRQKEVYDEVAESLNDGEDTEKFLALLVARLVLLGEHSMDAGMLREARAWASDFGVLETAAEKHEMELSGSVESELSVPDHVSEAIATAAESNLEGGEES